MITKERATLEDLYGVPENQKAELVEGEIVLMSPTGDAPLIAAANIYFKLRLFAEETKLGLAVPDNGAFIANLPNRKSFSPDAAFYTGPRTGMKFYSEPPVFAVEVRSENDYGPPAEIAMAKKREDYFAAGTLVVWDVDLLGDDVIKVYRSSNSKHPTIYRRGDSAEAEPAVPGWTMHVDDLFF